MREYCFEEIIKLVKRDKNKNRKFLFLNLLQGKYVPSDPRETLNLFETLGKKLVEKYHGKRICVIGFAETATAIAASIANIFEQRVYFLHTTREELPKEYFMTEFQEEHSHAKRHRLYSVEKEIFQKSDVIILIDDEFTTGKTVRNFIKNLREKQWIGAECKVVAASLINCMQSEHLNCFEEQKIEYEYLLRKEEDWNHFQWESSLEMKYVEKVKGKKVSKFNEIKIQGKKDARLGIYNNEYKAGCEELAWNIIDKIEFDNRKSENILVLGTEEFMYPAIYTAKKIQEVFPNKQCRVHATSRSPIVAMNNENYPVRNRDKIISFYDEEREVFLYNLTNYDQVLIVSDAETISEDAKKNIEEVMEQYNNYNITLVQWTK